MQPALPQPPMMSCWIDVLVDVCVGFKAFAEDLYLIVIVVDVAISLSSGSEEAISYTCAPPSPASHMIGRAICAAGDAQQKTFTPRGPTRTNRAYAKSGDANVTHVSGQQLAGRGQHMLGEHGSLIAASGDGATESVVLVAKANTAHASWAWRSAMQSKTTCAMYLAACVEETLRPGSVGQVHQTPRRGPSWRLPVMDHQ